MTSTPGKGATFTIYLPRATAPASEVEAAAAGSDTAPTGRGYRVLVVEDNDEVGQFSMELLEDLGYAAKRVANADAALAILAEDEFAAEFKRRAFRWAAERIKDEFTESTWRAFWRTGVDGQPVSEVAQELGLSPGAIRSRLHRQISRQQAAAWRTQ